MILIFLLIIIIIIYISYYISGGVDVSYILDTYNKKIPISKIKTDFPIEYNNKRYILRIYKTKANKYKYIDKYNITLNLISEFRKENGFIDYFDPQVAIFIYNFFNCKNILDTHMNIGYRYMAAVDIDANYIGYGNINNLYDTNICLQKTIENINSSDIKFNVDLIFCSPPPYLGNEIGKNKYINNINNIINKLYNIHTNYFILLLNDTNIHYTDEILKHINLYYRYEGCIPYTITGYISPLWIFKNLSEISKATARDELYILSHRKINIDMNKRYAIITLLMINDSYLSGLIMLAQSIKRFNIPNNIDLVCMVTKDINIKTINILKLFYKVYIVEYIELPADYINLRDEKIKLIYAKTFTKIHCMKYIEYDKIVLIDADMLVIKESFFNIFNYEAPAGVYHGLTDDYHRNILLEYMDAPINNKMYDKKIFNNNFGRNIIIEYKGVKKPLEFIRGVETSICLLKPDINDYNNMLNMIKSAKPKIYKSDTTLLNVYFLKKYGSWYHLDYNYLGRWSHNENDRKIIVIDYYGAKPWDINHFKTGWAYPQHRLWFRTYKDFYENIFNQDIKNDEIFKTLYEFCINQNYEDIPVSKFDNFYIYKIENHNIGCARIRHIDKIYIDKLYGDFMPVLNYLLFWNKGHTYIKSPIVLDLKLKSKKKRIFYL